MKWPRWWMAAFLEALGTTANVDLSCRLVNVSKVTAYYHRKHNPQFEAAWTDALKSVEARQVERIRRTVAPLVA